MRPCPSCGWVPASQPGSEDLSERREHRGAQVCPPACLLMYTPAAHCVESLHSVCRRPQVTICALSGATEIAWVALAQLGVQLQMRRACVHAVYGLRRACARIASERGSVLRVYGEGHADGARVGDARQTRRSHARPCTHKRVIQSRRPKRRHSTSSVAPKRQRALGPVSIFAATLHG